VGKISYQQDTVEKNKSVVLRIFKAAVFPPKASVYMHSLWKSSAHILALPHLTCSKKQVDLPWCAWTQCPSTPYNCLFIRDQHVSRSHTGNNNPSVVHQWSCYISPSTLCVHVNNKSSWGVV